MTIICRVETLESPSLEPKCIGLATLRLCVDLLGMQPLSEVLSDGKPSCFFNTGQFMVPILYGKFPQDIQFSTESKIQLACPHIDGAYLRMNVNPLAPGESPPTGSPFLVNKKSISPSNLNSKSAMISFHREITSVMNMSVDPLSVNSRSVGAILWKTFLASTTPRSVLPPMEISNEIIEKFRMGLGLDENEKFQVAHELSTWARERFEGCESFHAINPRFLLEYTDATGANAALDMLYNLPERTKLTQAAERAAHVAAMRSGLIKGWDSKLNYYKTVFRYLPGSFPTTSVKEESHLERVNENSRDKLVVDDASVKAIFESPETCPAFCDDFSSTEGLKLGPHACLLVVVTAIDVLISKKVAAQRPTASSGDLQDNSGGGRATSFLSPVSSKSSLVSEDVNSTRHHDRKMKKAKLRGLMGIYVGDKDPKATWWGIVPLFAKFPAAVLGNAAVIPPTEQVTPSKRDEADFTFQGTEGFSNQPSMDGDNQNNTNVSSTNTSSAALSSLTALPVFVNSGTHQIPLFKGLPPEEMINSDDPMAWLLTRIHHQLSRQAVAQHRMTSFQNVLLYPFLSCIPRSIFGGSSSNGSGSSSGAVSRANSNGSNILSPVSSSPTKPTRIGSKSEEKTSPVSSKPSQPNLLLNSMSSRHMSGVLNLDLSSLETDNVHVKGHGGKSHHKKKKKQKKVADIVLSDGSSALIRIIDPRVKRLASCPAAITASNTPANAPTFAGSLGSTKSTNSVGALRTSLRAVADTAIAAINNSNSHTGSYHNGNSSGVSGNGSTNGSAMGNSNSAGNATNGNNNGGTNGNGQSDYVSPYHVRIQHDLLEEILQLHALQALQDRTSLASDAAKLRSLKQAFALQPWRFAKKKTIKSSIPPSLDAALLVQEINTKFYEVISS